MPRTKPDDLVKYEDFTNKLAVRRTNLGMSQIDVAKMAGYQNANYISMIERGKSTIPLQSAIILADAYNLNRKDFLKAILMVRFPEIWEILLTILEGEPDITAKSRAKIEEETEQFIERLPKMSANRNK